MKKLNCLIVEDEPLAAEGLESYIREIPFLHFAGACRDAFSALKFLRENKVDVLFLDIHLPKLKGLDFLKTLERPPQVILTTAYHEYALEGYELNVVDYLLKPFGMPRFMAAVNKLSVHSPQSPIPNPQSPVPSPRPFHFFNENKRMVKVYEDEITHVESLKEYVRLFLADGRKVVTRSQMGEMERKLAGGAFLRIHRSYMVAVGKITAFTAATIEVGEVELPIGRVYRERVKKVLEGYSAGEGG